MRARTAFTLMGAVYVLAGCSSGLHVSSPPRLAQPFTQPAAQLESSSLNAGSLVADTPHITAAGNTFIAPAGWILTVRGSTTVLEAPERGSSIALVDIQAGDADAAVAAAWLAYDPDARWVPKVITPAAPRDGWTNRRLYSYETSPNERRDVAADVRRANGIWTVAIHDMATDVAEKRAAQVNLIFGKLLPKGYERESFAGKTAHTLDAARIGELGRFVRTAMQLTGVPGVSLGLYQHGKVVFADGFGLREVGKPTRVDADTRYMIASNTKGMTTLMLAKLLDEGRLSWESPAVSLLPSFRLGNAQTTSRVLVKHLICACTGMPRQDLEWLLEFEHMTPEGAMTLLSTMQPTTRFGELFQYSNPMAAAAGYIGGHVAFPDLELGAAYDLAMETRVFGPLGMNDTTHDFERARRGNVAVPHAIDINGRTALAEARANLSILPMRPAAGAWSTVNDVLRYVAMELAEGRLPDGRRYISRDALLARQAPQVSVSADLTYGMGLFVDRSYGTPVVHHGGNMIGFYTDMMWLPDHGVGAVILTNGEPGWLIRSAFHRKLLEVLFDGSAEADAQLDAQARSFFTETAAERRTLTLPADPATAGELASRYSHPALGEVVVTRQGTALRFDFGEWSSEMASRMNPDGTQSVVTTVPGFSGLPFVLGRRGSKRTLTLRDAQHEYVLQER